MAGYHIGFILEQALGHVTHSANLQANVPCDSDISASWALIPFDAGGLARRIPVYNSNWTVRAGLRARRAVAALVRRARLDALFFHTQVPAILSTDWLRRLPGIVSLDATPLQYDRLGQFYNHARGSETMELFKWRLNCDCYRVARHLVAWTHWTARGLVSEYDVPAEKITVIPPGVNTSEWMRSTPRVLHTGPVKLLFVGGNLERKGGLLLVEAFHALRDLGVELHLVTKDTLPPEPGLFIYNHMLPNSPELKQLYHACDIFCLPTYGDCLPMVLSEAGAAGLPTVSTRLAGIPEIVREGETGLLVPTGDVPALTEALRGLITNADLRLRLGAQAITVVSREFDAPRNTRRLLDLLKIQVDTARIALKVT